MFFKSTFSGGKCYDYKWLRGLNSGSPEVWCQRSDGVNVTGKDLSQIPLHNTPTMRAKSEYYCKFDTCVCVVRCEIHSKY